MKTLFKICALSSAIAATTAHGAVGIDVASEAHRPGELLVKYKVDADSLYADQMLRGHGADNVRQFRRPRAMASSPIDRWRHVRLAPGTDLARAMDRIARDPSVERVEPNFIVTAQVTPNDPNFSSLWAMNNTGQTGGTADADIDAVEAWDIATGDGTIIVGTVDTGVDWDHVDLAANMWTNPGEVAGNNIDDDGNGFVDDVHGYDFVNNDGNPNDDNDHGTHVSGTFGAVGNNGIGVTGVNWNVQIMGIKFLSSSGSGTIADAVDALLYGIDNGAKVLNNSWGGGSSAALEDAIATGEAADVLMVFAAGNAGVNCDVSSCLPADLTNPNIISVASTDHNDNMSSFSSFGALSVDLGAPGSSILSTIRNNNYATFDGTSMATPHVAGAAALYWSQNPTATYDQVKDAILASVDPIPALAGRTVTGGRLNLNNLLSGDIPPPDENEPPIANAGPDQTAAPRAFVTMDATGSSDADGSIVSYAWTVTQGRLRLVNANTATPRARIPARAVPGTQFVLEVTVTDDDGATASDTMTITVQ